MNVHAAATDHLIKKGNIESKLRPKLPYGHGKGAFNSATEYKQEYPGKNGNPSDLMKTPDNINFGDSKDRSTAHKEHYKNIGGCPNVKEAQLNTHGLKLNIKADGKFGHLFKNKEEHNEKYNRDKDGLKDNAFEKSGVWIKGKNEKLNLASGKETTHKKHYRGHSSDFVKQNERFDNLKNPKGIDSKELTNYREKHQGKEPNVKPDSTLHNLSRVFDKETDRIFKTPDWQGKPQYKRDYSSNIHKINNPEKSHVGRDDNMKDFLYQYHHGYYHTD
jgi:hypothetical protein